MKKNNRASFYLSKYNKKNKKFFKISSKYIIDYILDKETLGRATVDKGVKVLIKYIEGIDKIVELGGEGDYYKKFTNVDQKYEVTNLSGGDKIIDMTDMNFSNDSINSFFSAFALEHIYDFDKVIDECYRCLKPGGRLLLAVPFMYQYHGAPEDYFRFTHSSLDKLLEKFNILEKKSFGNRSLIVSGLFHEKVACGSRHSFMLRFFLRCIGIPFLINGLFRNQNDKVYAIAHLYLCEKPLNI